MFGTFYGQFLWQVSLSCYTAAQVLRNSFLFICSFLSLWRASISASVSSVQHSVWNIWESQEERRGYLETEMLVVKGTTQWWSLTLFPVVRVFWVHVKPGCSFSLISCSECLKLTSVRLPAHSLSVSSGYEVSQRHKKMELDSKRNAPLK